MQDAHKSFDIACDPDRDQAFSSVALGRITVYYLTNIYSIKHDLSLHTHILAMSRLIKLRELSYSYRDPPIEYTELWRAISYTNFIGVLSIEQERENRWGINTWAIGGVEPKRIQPESLQSKGGLSGPQHKYNN